MQPDIRVRRVYDAPEPQDGRRVLVDRLWPRGLRKDAARFDEWAKDVAPSTELRKWYGHDPEKFGQFCRRYTAELAQGTPRSALDHLAALTAAGPVTLLTATRDVDHSEAVVLAQLLRQQPSGESAEGGEAACYAHLVCPECGAVSTEGHRSECSSA
jgi:uncharacterized protein YeaO (DUF488 family)